MLARIVDWLFRLFWPLVRKKIMSETITVNGKIFTFGDIILAVNTVPVIRQKAAAGKGITEIISELEPAAIPIIEALSDLFFPGLGKIEAVVLAIVKQSRPMTQEETNAWMDRFGASNA
jgi:hypothetical protein